MQSLNGMVVAVGIAFCATLVAAEAQAANFIVNSVAEPGDGTCDASECTLREAVDSLATSGDQILFDFSASGLTAPFEIEVASPLDIDQSGVIVDGLVCTGCGTVQGASTTAAQGFDSSLAMRVVAAGGFSGDSLITISADSVTIRGLNIDGSPGNGVSVTADLVTIEDCFIGTDIDGSSGLGNTAAGIEVVQPNAQIGPGNVLSGNGSHGVYVHDGDADTPTIEGNIIGLGRSGQVSDGNSGAGVYLTAASAGSLLGPTVGGASASEGNVISGNTGNGILIELSVQGTGATLIGNNIIGLNGTGTAARGNGGDGIRLLGGSSAGSEPDQMTFSGNLIGGNGGSGIHLESAKSNTFSNNTIGTDTTGTAQLGNSEEGIFLLGGTGKDTEGNVIGGVGLENVIAYNVGDGVRMKVVGSAKVKENTVGANSIYGNGGIGVDIEAASSGDGAGDPVANTCSDHNSWGNRQASAPVITSASLIGGILTVAGEACPDAVVDIYTASSDDQPESYQGTGQADASTGVFLIAVVVAPGEGAGEATALQTDTDGETGEAATPLVIVAPCDLDGDGVDGSISSCSGLDCDDADADTYPGALELCDGVDNDCVNGIPTDELDTDTDTFSECEGDCDDSQLTVYPLAPELCDGLDNDCVNGIPGDETDDDGDGDTECGDGDCDDTNITVFVGAVEVCDGFDTDCTDGIPADESDDDGDGFNECADGDCDDVDVDVFPGAEEVCNGADDDCDSVVPADELDADSDGLIGCEGDCDDGDVNVLPGAPEICDGKDSNCDTEIPADEADADGDGAILCDDSDCDDDDASVYEGAPELCDGIDNDCDTVIDEVEDLDLDGFTNCDGDCDDLDPDVYPGAPEICDGKDSNCDSAIGTEELDGDEDGVFPCDGDCDDDDAQIYEGAEDLCDDGIDQDCDGEDTPCEEPCDDEDLDGDGMSECDGDCDDADSSVSPAAPEICDDELDQDCDGQDVSCVDVMLGEVPAQGCDCAASVARGGGASSAWALLFGGLLLRRRRRTVSWSLLPVTVALSAMALVGCADVGGGAVQTWWGNLPEAGVAATFEAGGGFVAGAVAQAVDPTLVDGRSVVEVVLGGDRHPLTCDGLTLLADEATSVEAALLESLDGGDLAELAGWACQELRGVAREAFGGDQWHAIHALMEPGEAGRARPAVSSLVPGAFIARVVDLSGPGALAPEPGGDGCAARVANRLSEGPLDAGFLAEAAVSRLEHKSVPADLLNRVDFGSAVQVGMSFPEGLAGPAQAGTVDLTGFVSTDAAGVFDTMIFSTQGDPVITEPCAVFAFTRHLAWPDLGVEPPDGTGDDDDDGGDR